MHLEIQSKTVLNSECNHAYPWLLVRKQILHSFGLHLHLLERMFGVKELCIYFVWGKEP